MELASPPLPLLGLGTLPLRRILAFSSGRLESGSHSSPGMQVACGVRTEREPSWLRIPQPAPSALRIPGGPQSIIEQPGRGRGHMLQLACVCSLQHFPIPAAQSPCPGTRSSAWLGAQGSGYWDSGSGGGRAPLGLVLGTEPGLQNQTRAGSPPAVLTGTFGSFIVLICEILRVEGSAC